MGYFSLPDPQIAGVYDDGSDTGYMRAMPMRGDAVLMSLRQGHFVAEVAGGSTTANVETGIPASDWATPDTLQCVAAIDAGLLHPSGTVNKSGVRIRVPFYGPLFGVAINRPGTILANKISVRVDGRAYPGISSFQDWITSRGLSLYDGTGIAIVDVAIPDTPNGMAHVAEIGIVSDGLASNTVQISGILVDRRFGPPPVEPCATPIVGTLTASFVGISKGSGNNQLENISAIVYCNTDTVNRTVTIQWNATQNFTLILTPGQTQSFPLPLRGMFATTTVTHKADAAAVVNFWTWVGRR